MFTECVLYGEPNPELSYLHMALQEEWKEQQVVIIVGHLI